MKKIFNPLGAGIRTSLSVCLLAAALLPSCKSGDGGDTGTQTGTDTGSKTTTETEKTVSVPQFSADSAYAYIEKQVSFGPRVPNSKAHDQCAEWMAAKLRQYTPNVEVQKGTVKAWDGKQLPIQNIMATFNPEAQTKVLVAAHWDSRPWNDQDKTIPKKDLKPIDGANDGGSGVGVIIEMARQFAAQKPDVGVVLLLVDAEDYGNPDYESSYCLGTQYWAEHLDKTKHIADYGVVLDMVGGKGARFLQEEFSMKYASSVVQKVWNMAGGLGYRSYFVVSPTGPITDDHVYINQIASIPTIDIVDFDMGREHGFGDYWHTLNDNMSVIDKGTLKAVGQTMLGVIYTEKNKPL